MYSRKGKDQWIWFKNRNLPYSAKYQGQIENDKPNGEGALTYLNGTKYVGQFKDGTWSGEGIFFFPGGEKWVGEFRNDEPWNINWYDKNEKVLATWENGVKK